MLALFSHLTLGKNIVKTTLGKNIITSIKSHPFCYFEAKSLCCLMGREKGRGKRKASPPFPSFFHSGDRVDTAPCSAISLSSSFSFSLFIGSFSSVCLQRRQAESILWNVMWKLLWSHASYINHQNDIFWKEAIALLTIVPQKVIKDRENFTTAFMSLFKSNTDPENTM